MNFLRCYRSVEIKLFGSKSNDVETDCDIIIDLKKNLFLVVGRNETDISEETQVMFWVFRELNPIPRI